MRLLISFILFVTIFAIGCGEDVKEEMEIEIEEETVVPAQTPLEKAQAAMARIDKRRMEAHQKAKEAGDFSTVFDTAEKIFQEEVGFGEVIWTALFNTWEQMQEELNREGKIDNAALQRYMNFVLAYHNEEGFIKAESFFEFNSAYDEVVIKYLQLSYASPNTTHDELLVLLQESIREGEVKIQYPKGF